MKTDTISNQLRWVILLLAAAVILPTVCLLWFMNQAVRNVRMAAQSQLSSICRGEVSRVFDPFLEWIHAETQHARTALSGSDPYEAYVKLAEHQSAFECRGLFLYDQKAGQVLYPSVWKDTGHPDTTGQLAEAMHSEFSEQNFEAALDIYRHLLDDYADYERTDTIGSLDPVLYKLCKLAQARIIAKQGQLKAAIDLCESVQREPLEDAASWYYYTAANLKILDLLEAQGLTERNQAERLNERIENLLSVLRTIRFLSSDQRVMAYEKVLALGARYPNLLTQHVRDELAALEDRMELERASLAMLYQQDDLLMQPTARLFEKMAGTELYAFTLHAGPVWAVKVVDAESIVRNLSQNLNLSDAIVCRIMNTHNEVVAGPDTVTQAPFLSFPMAGFFEWTVAFYEADMNGNVFEAAARRQTVVYLWTGVLVVVLILTAGAYSIRAVSHQIKMNRLKNDFIATVTHELKTPLASMRLLVDTLLEGRYDDKTTVPEYLSLIARENQRLTHLIDSFLTFSRMERNKQVFELQRTAPNEIAAAAVDAMQGKLTGSDWGFACRIDEPLPFVNADKDAMVTVLVNLLDNACKYTHGEKQIELHVSEQDGKVCFAVRDNGIGISLRAQKKIFNRFYQVDSRLSRRSEGCGLGLSIVSFIVDAHHGQVAVESQPGQGSTFIVKLPKLSCRA